MSAATGVLQRRAERLMDERATVSQLHDDLLTHVEAREGEQGLTDIEQKQIDGYRARSAELDSELADLKSQMEREAASMSATKDIRAFIAGQHPGVEQDGEGLHYRSFAAYARDFIIARGPGNIGEQIVALAGGEDAKLAARERLQRSGLARTPATTLSSNVGGLQPPQHLAQIFQVIDKSRGLVAAAQRRDLVRGTLTYPKVTQRPVVAVQETEKTEAGNTGLVIGMESTTATTYLGGGNISWQSVEWSDPSALEAWFDFAAADYALKTETDAATVVSADAFVNDQIGSPIGATPTYVELMAAIGAGGGEVYANSGRMANSVIMAPDRWWYLVGLATASPFGVFDSSGSLLNGDGPKLRPIVSRGLNAGEIIVGDMDGLVVAENPGAPVQLRVVEPAIGGYEVGLIGAFEAVVVDSGAFSLITTAS